LLNFIEGNEEFTANIRPIKTIPRVMQKNAAIRQYGKACPDFPETRWMYACEALNWILTERGESVPFIVQCIENRNEIGELLRATRFSEGPPA
jgi:hypothetical protein